MPTFINRESGSFKFKWLIWTVIVIAVLIGAYFLFFNKKTQYQFITVQKGSIIESVSVTGNTIPTKSVSLAFGSSGIISNTYSDLGKQVSVGQVLAELNMNDLNASLHQAEASVNQQQARLRALESSSQPADASLAFITAMRDSYLQLETAVLRYSDTLFTNAISVNPSIQIRTQSQEEENAIEAERLIVGEKMEKWRNTLVNLNTTSDNQTIKNAESIARDTIVYTGSFMNHLGNITKNLTPENSGLLQSVIDSNRININTAAQAVSTTDTNEKNAYDTWISAPQNIDAQKALVKAAEASVESAQAKIQNAQIIAPISGTVTQFDAKIGQLASPGTPLVSIMSDTGYEVDAGVSEIDVGKISLGNEVTMTLDAFQNETFIGKVFYIAPAETNNQGVISYQIKISFDKPDIRLKSGLTANIDIQTRQKENVLILPQYAILQNDQGTFVETLENKVVKQNPVTLGLQDQKGNVEVISGVEEGKQVLNIGLKTK
ncbi:MAG: efflux RND transporter periplasmic adaptor subunit [Patescibacteria group bacterium]